MAGAVACGGAAPLAVEGAWVVDWVAECGGSTDLMTGGDGLAMLAATSGAHATAECRLVAEGAASLLMVANLRVLSRLSFSKRSFSARAASAAAVAKAISAALASSAAFSTRSSSSRFLSSYSFLLADACAFFGYHACSLSVSNVLFSVGFGQHVVES